MRKDFARIRGALKCWITYEVGRQGVLPSGIEVGHLGANVEAARAEFWPRPLSGEANATPPNSGGQTDVL
jgi:hypothetical protein